MKPFRILMFFPLLSACFDGTDPYLRFAQEFPQTGIEQCLVENPTVSNSQCDIKQCLSNRFILKGIDKLLHDTDEVLSAMNIRYWLEGATLLGAIRFKAYLPWDDDADIGVFSTEFEPRLEEFRRAMAQKGYRIIEFGGPLGRVAGFWQILFTKDNFRRHLLETDPDISMNEVDRLVEEYDLYDYLPHLDIFPYDKEGELWQIREPVFKEQSKEGFLEDTLAPKTGPQPRLPILDTKQFAVANNLPLFLRTWYHTDAVAKDVLLTTPHSSQCTAQLRFPDVTKHKELLQYLKEYLKFVFGDRFKGFTDELGG